MPKYLRILAQAAVFTAIYWACTIVVQLTALPVPANVLGIVTLFLLLCTGVVKEQHVDEAAVFILNHLVFLFIPIAVGLMQWGEVFYGYGAVLLGVILISALLPLVLAGWLATRWFKEKAL